MNLLAAYDPYVVFALSVGVVLVLCAAIMLLMRDPYNVPPHPVSRRVWCEDKHRSADVDFTESVVTGMVHRSVQHCSLLGTHEACSGACCYQPVDPMPSPR
jgi:hypothetical protein